MPSKSAKQRRFMAAAAHNPKFAKKAGISQSVAQEFHAADKREGHAKGGKIRTPRTELDAIREYSDSLGPQKGFFSTLDKLIEEAPFEQAPPDQWRGYLQPGRMLKREGTQFPLKQEELDWSEFHNLLDAYDTEEFGAVPKEWLLQALRENRPRFALDVSAETGQGDRYNQLIGPYINGQRDPSRVKFTSQRYGPRFDPRYSHQSPGSKYEESVTRMPEVIDNRGHFSNDALSWSRSSTHQLPSGEKMRLIEEIQSDLHARAARRIEELGPNNPSSWEKYLTEQEQENVEDARALLGKYRYGSGNMRHVPDAERPAYDEAVKLIADYFEMAEKRVPRQGYYSVPERQRYVELNRMERLAENDPTGYLDDQGADLYNMRANLLDEFAQTGRLYGYDPEIGRHVGDESEALADLFRDMGHYPEHTHTYEQVFDQLNQPLLDVVAEGKRRIGWTPEARDELRALSRKVESGVSDAPFKGPADYGALEIRKQLLDAVEQGQDYLAITPPEVQIERYGFENEPDGFGPNNDYKKQIEGMNYIYGELYPSALKKLANRFGAELTTVEAPLGSKADIRPSIFRNAGTEDVREWMELVSGTPTAGMFADSVKLVDALSTNRTTVEETDALKKLWSDWAKIEDNINEFERTAEDLRYGPNATPISAADYNKVMRGFDTAARDVVKRLETGMNKLYDQYEQGYFEMHPDLRQEAMRKFPAIRLTPEVRERIKRIGVPLFSVVGGALMFNDETEGAEFAKGGRVKRALDHLDQNLKSIDESAVGMAGLGLLPALTVSTYEEYKRYKEIKRIREQLLRDREQRKTERGYAEGGEVENWDLEDLKTAFAAMNPGLAGLARNASDAAEHFPHGFRTQWMGLDDQGAPRGAIYSDYDAPKEDWVYNSEAQMPLPPQRTVQPGLVSDTLALPAFFGYEGSETSNDAMLRSGALEMALRDQYGVPEPESWGDFIGESGGVMGAQIPMPGGLGKGAATKLSRYIPGFMKAAMNSRLVRWPAKLAGSIPEFMLPTIEPSAANYGLGTAAGAVLMKMLPELRDGETASPESEDLGWLDPELPALINEAELNGEISADEAEEAYRAIKAARGRLEPSPKEVPMTTGGGFAKGGRIYTGRKPLLSNEQLKVAHEMYSDGQSIAQIADTLQIPYARLYKRLTRAGLAPVQPIVRNELTPEARLEAVQRALAGENQYKIAEDLGVSQPSISLLKKKAGEIEGHAKGGRIKRNLLREAVNLYSTLPKAPDVRTQAYVYDEILNRLEQHARETGTPIDDVFDTFELSKGDDTPFFGPRESPIKHAKGGKVITDLRRKLANLIAPTEAGVEGTGQEMVPVERVDPATGEPLGDVPALADLERRIRAERTNPLPSPEEPTGTVSRRDILRGMGHLAGAAISPVKVDPLSVLGDALTTPATVAKAAPVAAAAKKVALSAPKLAAFLTEAWGSIFHGSDESAILHEADRFDQLEGGEEIASALREWYRRMETDLPEGGYHNPANDPKDVDAALEQLNEEMDLEGKLQTFAESRGIMPDYDGWSETGDMVFAEPPNTVSRNDMTGGFARALQDAGHPEVAEKWRRVFADWGDRADAIMADFYGRPSEKPDERYFSDKALAKYGLNDEDLSSFMEYMEDLMGDHGDIRSWLGASPELRQKYHDLTKRYDEVGEKDTDGTDIHEEINSVLEQIYGINPGY